MKTKVANLSQVPVKEALSPQRTFRVQRQLLSQALSIRADQGVRDQGHPFEVERAMVPPGAQNYPLHSHAAQWEFYWIESGSGKLILDKEDEKPLTPGDFFMCAPGEAHALVNSSPDPLVYWVIADNPPADLIYYPKSKKWNAKPGKRVFRETIDYYDGEE